MNGAPAGDVERLTATIIGRVQGVGFRWWVRSAADRMGLTGWVMNGADERSVDVVAEGRAASLDQLEQMLRDGPPGAVVDRVEATRSPASGGYHRFQITRP
ncbi:MAG: acylphosphatase [Chloroflexota bacterium]